MKINKDLRESLKNGITYLSDKLLQKKIGSITYSILHIEN